MTKLRSGAAGPLAFRWRWTSGMKFLPQSLVHPATLTGCVLWAAHSCLSSCLGHFPKGLFRLLERKIGVMICSASNYCFYLIIFYLCFSTKFLKVANVFQINDYSPKNVSILNVFTENSMYTNAWLCIYVPWPLFNSHPFQPMPLSTLSSKLNIVLQLLLVNLTFWTASNISLCLKSNSCLRSWFTHCIRPSWSQHIFQLPNRHPANMTWLLYELVFQLNLLINQLIQ